MAIWLKFFSSDNIEKQSVNVDGRNDNNSSTINSHTIRIECIVAMLPILAKKRMNEVEQCPGNNYIVIDGHY